MINSWETNAPKWTHGTEVDIKWQWLDINTFQELSKEKCTTDNVIWDTMPHWLCFIREKRKGSQGGDPEIEELLSEVSCDDTRQLFHLPLGYRMDREAHGPYLIATGLSLWAHLHSLRSLFQNHSCHVHHWLNLSSQELLVCCVPGSVSNDWTLGTLLQLGSQGTGVSNGLVFPILWPPATERQRKRDSI